MTQVNNYLNLFNYGNEITNPQLWEEMDNVWDTLKLNNKIDFSNQNIGAFYAHPVWILNGLFSEIDKISLKHRENIVEFADNYFQNKKEINIADFGGGSGVLAKIFENKMSNLNKLDIIEPWPSEFFVNKLSKYKKLNFSNNFINENYYDLIIAQDVLEHVENPIETAFECINATKKHGILIFANCFYPVIKCHLPKNFYLRHLFKFVVTSKNLKYIGRVPGAEHMEIYKKIDNTSLNIITRVKIQLSKIIGPSLNYTLTKIIKFKNNFKYN
jgi:2-polyprenyl-3-methyl-5-hydroxy-6-metoxy-1,4-benzoquinol methylase